MVRLFDWLGDFSTWTSGSSSTAVRSELPLYFIANVVTASRANHKGDVIHVAILWAVDILSDLRFRLRFGKSNR